MKPTRQGKIAIILSILVVAIHAYSANADRVEKGYSMHLFDTIATVLRYTFGWLPFSFGDILYLAAAIWLAVKVFALVKKICRKGAFAKMKKHFWQKALKLYVILSCLYIIFNLFWGINYNRLGIASQLGLKMDKYTTEDVKAMNNLLIEKINSAKEILVKSGRSYPTNKELTGLVKQAYDTLSQQYTFLQYKPVSLKPSMWGWLGNYAGFTGYYNPFTGEAQLNTTVPKFLQPYTACHEVAHQLGYAKEMEANFVGYLAAASSTDALFKYSVYLDLFNYANRNLYFTDSAAARVYRKQLSPDVVKDIKEWIAFSKKHENPVEPFIRWGYGVFLKGNQQPQGIQSYDEVTGFIIAYYKKFGKL